MTFSGSLLFEFETAAHEFLLIHDALAVETIASVAPVGAVSIANRVRQRQAARVKL